MFFTSCVVFDLSVVPVPVVVVLIYAYFVCSVMDPKILLEVSEYMRIREFSPGLLMCLLSREKCSCIHVRLLLCEISLRLLRAASEKKYGQNIWRWCLSGVEVRGLAG